MKFYGENHHTLSLKKILYTLKLGGVLLSLFPQVSEQATLFSMQEKKKHTQQ